MTALQEIIASYLHPEYSLHSRVHPLRSYSFDEAKVFVKRDDELGFGISGSKMRKYSSLIPFLIAHKFQEVVLIGGAYSNNVLGLVQLLIENGIKATLFLREDVGDDLKGNRLLLSLLVDEQTIHWISRK